MAYFAGWGVETRKGTTRYGEQAIHHLDEVLDAFRAFGMDYHGDLSTCQGPGKSIAASSAKPITSPSGMRHRFRVNGTPNDHATY